jgi:hypothetical protein
MGADHSGKQARLQFFQEKLEHQVDQGTALSYLQEKYEAFLTGVITEEPSTPEPEEEGSSDFVGQGPEGPRHAAGSAETLIVCHCYCVFLDLHYFLGSDFHLGRLQFDDEMIQLVRTMPAQSARKHKVHNTACFADVLYRLVDDYIIAECEDLLNPPARALRPMTQCLCCPRCGFIRVT